MFSTLPGTIIVYHGTSRDEAERVVGGRGSEHLRRSTKDYDWLGGAVYFWENSEARAEEWAKDKHADQEAVLGAVLQLGSCLDLLDQQFIDVFERAAADMCKDFGRLGKPIPQNTGRGAHRFDCVLVEYILAAPAEKQYGRFDSARAAYIEGKRILGRSAFRRQTHIQIAVYNPNCIKGCFWPQEETILNQSVGSVS
jgi:hypothetical protein